MATMNAIVEDTTELLRLFQELEESTKDMSEVDKAAEYEVLATWLGDNEEQFSRKVDGYVSVIREFMAMEQAAKEEAKRLQDRAKQHANKVESLKDMLKHSMKSIGLEKCKTAFNTVTIATNGGVRPMTINENLIPEEYLKTTKTADKAKINEAIAKDIEIKGVTLHERGKSLRIR